MWCLPSEGVRELRIPLGEFRLPPELDRLPGDRKHLQRVNEKKRGKKKNGKREQGKTATITERRKLFLQHIS